MEQPSRADAAGLILSVVERALNPAEHADIEAWIERREEEEGGFLWLTAALGAQPNVVETRIRALFSISPRERQQLRQRLTKSLRNGTDAA